MGKREHVLLQVKKVQYEKVNGTLFMTSLGFKWIANHEHTVMSYRYADIRVQMITPNNNLEVKWRVVVHDGSILTFQFTNETENAPLFERNQVKDLLQTKIDEEKDGCHSDKRRGFTKRLHLVPLYRDLVLSRILTDREFWNIINTQDCPFDINKTITLSAGVAVDIMPYMNPTSVVFKYNLPPEIIDCVFRTFPTVILTHDKILPVTIDPDQYWKDFVKSEYFYSNAFKSFDQTSDIFSESDTSDEMSLKNSSSDTLFNLNDLEFDDETFNSSTFDESFVINHKSISSLINRINQKSMMILQTVNENSSAYEKSAKEKSKEEILSEKSKKKLLILSNLDLISGWMHVEIPARNGCPEVEQLEMDLLDMQLEETISTVQKMVSAPDENLLDNDFLKTQLIKTTSTWKYRKPFEKTIAPYVATSVLNELTISGYQWHRFLNENRKDRIPLKLQRDLNDLYNSLSVLLKQFWSCFPTLTPEMGMKASHFHDVILIYHHRKIEGFEYFLTKEYLVIASGFIQHLHKLVQAAKHKFVTWQQKKIDKFIKF